jgi:hypothetical protein
MLLEMILAILFRSFRFIAPKDFLTIWLSNLLSVTVSDEGYRIPLNWISAGFDYVYSIYYSIIA